VLVEVLFFLGPGSGRSVRERGWRWRVRVEVSKMVAAGSLERPVKAGPGRGR